MILIYGSTGYTGRLVAAEAVAKGLVPTLSARNAEALREQAESARLPWRAASLDDPASLDAALKDMRVVIHCAGPFSQTWRAMSDACLRNGVHYLDITGEILVFESLARRDAEAKSAGIMLMPGAGFDVVPSDCLAVHLKRRLPDAVRLMLAFRSLGGPSRGTLATMTQGLGRPGAVRRGGRIIPVPPAWRTRQIDYGDGKPRDSSTIPWGDVSTAFHSTGIQDIEVYMSMSAATRRSAKFSRFLGPVLRSGPVQSYLAGRLRRGPAGPSDETRARSDSLLWGRVEAADGRFAETLLRAPNGYTLTALTSVNIASRVVMKGEAPVGFQTPARAYGADLIMEIPGVTRRDL